MRQERERAAGSESGGGRTLLAGSDAHIRSVSRSGSAGLCRVRHCVLNMRESHEDVELSEECC